MRALLVAVLLLAASLAGCLGSEQRSGAGEAPSWSFTDTTGETHSQQTAAGTPTVIFYMATWCSSCQQKTTDLREIHEEYDDAGVDVFSLTVDPGEGDDDLRRWKQQYDQPWPHGVDEQAQMQRAHGIDSQSSVVVLDADGYIAEHWGYGQATYEEISTVIEGLGP